MITIPSLHHQTCVVVGLAASGMAAARCLTASGANVWVWDDHESRRLDAAAAGFSILPSPDLLASEPITALILSPGIPHDLPIPHPLAALALRHSIPIWCDIELFARALQDHGFKGKVFGITGTNGKSTTTALLTHLFQGAGFNAHMGGNIGIPVLDLPFSLTPNTYYILELSSFQLERVPGLSLDGAILLNITPDHLDRHGTLKQYTRIKESIFTHLKPGGIAVRMDPWDTLEDDIPSSLVGRHNRQNVAAAHRIWQGLNLSTGDFAAGALSFSGLPHRLEQVGQIGHVRYINDSKATNGDAAFRALDSFDRIYWIVGGVPKDGGLNGVQEFYPKIVKAYTVGDAGDAFAAFLAPHVPVQKSGDIETALKKAHRDAATDPKPSVVLLSPACASYDQFRHFEHRGDFFRDLVHQIARGEKT